MRQSTLRWSFLATLLSSALAQTSTKCNPLTQSCPSDKALGGSADIDFTQGQSSDFTSTGNGISYGSDGLELTISKQGDSPTVISDFYIMFGRVDVELKASPGTGIVTSSVLQSDDLDEIDWEFLGGDANQVQTNYFGKGQTGSYNRGGFSSAPSSQSDFNTYTIDWNANQLDWQINGATVRQLTAQDAAGQYPQTPMQIKIGTWAGGDPSENAPGTVSWAGGDVDYSSGPFSAYVKSVKVQDYSTGTSYYYTGSSGSWQSIKSNGGSVNSEGGSASMSNIDPPSTTHQASGQPTPFEGTHADPTSAYTTPSIYPWVVTGSATFSASAAHAGTSIPSVPSGWSPSSGSSEAASSGARSYLASSSSGAYSSASPSGGSIPAAGGSAEASTITSAVAAPTFPGSSGGAQASGSAPLAPLASGMTTSVAGNTTTPSVQSPTPSPFTAGASQLGPAAKSLVIGAGVVAMFVLLA